jgi:glycosyltransferase involved in cell wall biosynthesis
MSPSPSDPPASAPAVPGAPPSPRLLIVSPVRNEAPHIARVARAVAAQELAPARWIAIDDGSSDGTLGRLHDLRAQIPCLTVLRAPGRDPAAGARDRLAHAVEARNFNIALAYAGWREYTHVMKLDGDVELPPDYLRRLLARFAAEPRLGLAGGVLVEPRAGGGTRPVAIARDHVHGALKCYTRACLEAIGGVQERLGWDTIDETYARMRGFHTRSLPELVCVHHRPLASADGALRGHARHGRCAYITHQGALWVALRALKVAARAPRGLSGGAFLYGYASAALRREPRVADGDYRRFTRRELRGRLARALAPRERAPRTPREQGPIRGVS